MENYHHFFLDEEKKVSEPSPPPPPPQLSDFSGLMQHYSKHPILKHPSTPGGHFHWRLILMPEKKKKTEKGCFSGVGVDAQTAERVSKSQKTGYPNCYDQSLAVRLYMERVDK